MNRTSYISHKTGTIWTLPTFFHDKNIFQGDPLGFLRLNVPESLVHYKTRDFTQPLNYSFQANYALFPWISPCEKVGFLYQNQYMVHPCLLDRGINFLEGLMVFWLTILYKDLADAKFNLLKYENLISDFRNDQNDWNLI